MKNEICVPASALVAGGGAADSSDQDMATPAVGDEVDFSGKGKVTRIEGDNAYIETTEVNGEPVMAHDSKPDETAPEDDESSMDNMVAQSRGASAEGY